MSRTLLIQPGHTETDLLEGNHADQQHALCHFDPERVHVELDYSVLQHSDHEHGKEAGVSAAQLRRATPPPEPMESVAVGSRPHLTGAISRGVDVAEHVVHCGRIGGGGVCFGLC